MVKDACQHVRSAAGAARSIDQSIPYAADDRTVERIEKDVVGDPIGGEYMQTGEQVDNQGINRHCKGRAQHKTLPAQVAPAQHKQGHVSHENHQTDRPAGKVIDQLWNPADASAGKVCRDQEHSQPDALNGRTDQEQGIIKKIWQKVFGGSWHSFSYLKTCYDGSARLSLTH